MKPVGDIGISRSSLLGGLNIIAEHEASFMSREFDLAVLLSVPFRGIQPSLVTLLETSRSMRPENDRHGLRSTKLHVGLLDSPIVSTLRV